MHAITDARLRSMLKQTAWLINEEAGFADTRYKGHMLQAMRHMLNLAEYSAELSQPKMLAAKTMDSLLSIWFGYCVHTLIFSRFDVNKASMKIRGMSGGAKKVTFDGHQYEFRHLLLAEKLSVLTGLAAAGRSSVALFDEIVKAFNVSWDMLYLQYMKRLFWLRCSTEPRESPWTAFDTAGAHVGNQAHLVTASNTNVAESKYLPNGGDFGH